MRKRVLALTLVLALGLGSSGYAWKFNAATDSVS